MDQNEMKIINELQTSDLPDQFQEFSSIVEATTWLKAARKARDEVKSNPFLSDYLQQRHSLPLTLTRLTEHWERYRNIPEQIANVEQYQAYTFISQVVNLYNQFRPALRKPFLGRVRGAFRNPEDQEALMHELEIATHLSRRNFQIDFPEHLGIGSFDWLATLDDLNIEVECKFISSGKGRQIKTRQVLETQHLIKIELNKIIKRSVGGVLIRVRLNTETLIHHSSRLSIVEAIKACLLSNSKIQEPWGVVEIHQFQLASSPFVTKHVDPSVISDFLDRSYNIKNKEVMSLYAPNQRAIMISLESSKDDTLIESTFATIEDAARRQLSGTRPGILCIKFQDLTEDQMHNIGNEDGSPSALRVAASNFLDNSKHKHIACLAFFADGQLERLDSDVVTKSGAVYYFFNDRSSWGSESRLRIFSRN